MISTYSRMYHISYTCRLTYNPPIMYYILRLDLYTEVFGHHIGLLVLHNSIHSYEKPYTSTSTLLLIFMFKFLQHTGHQICLILF